MLVLKGGTFLGSISSQSPQWLMATSELTHCKGCYVANDYKLKKKKCRFLTSGSGGKILNWVSLAEVK